MKTIDASDFDADCLAIPDRARVTGERVTIVRNGQPVAEPVPVSREETRYPQDEPEGAVVIRGDIIEPAVPEEQRDALKP